MLLRVFLLHWGACPWAEWGVGASLQGWGFLPLALRVQRGCPLCPANESPRMSMGMSTSIWLGWGHC